MPAIDLRRLCQDLADELGEVSVTTEHEAQVYARGGVDFARARAEVMELRLPPDIGEAATRTPDAGAGGDPDWVRFAPTSGEQHVSDRAEAWFRTAWRHAGGR